MFAGRMVKVVCAIHYPVHPDKLQVVFPGMRGSPVRGVFLRVPVSTAQIASINFEQAPNVTPISALESEALENYIQAWRMPREDSRGEGTELIESKSARSLLFKLRNRRLEGGFKMVKSTSVCFRRVCAQ